MVSGEKLVLKFIEECIKYGEAQLEGNSKKVNKHAKEINKIRQELKENSFFSEAFLGLLEHPNNYVRLKAAFSMIPFSPEKAKQCLLELSALKGLLGFEAKMVLAEWDKRNLTF